MVPKKQSLWTSVKRKHAHVKKANKVLEDARTELAEASQVYAALHFGEVLRELKTLSWRKKPGWDGQRYWIAVLPEKSCIEKLHKDIESLGLSFSTYRGSGVTFEIEHKKSVEKVAISVIDYRGKQTVQAPIWFLKKNDIEMDFDPKKDKAKINKIIKDQELTSEELEDAIKALREKEMEKAAEEDTEIEDDEF